MNDFEIRLLYEKAITTYGMVGQTVVAIEELAELQKELTKALRGKLNPEHLTEEMADVTIMLDQLMMMYGIDRERLEQIMDEKLSRLERIMGGADE